ncbi:hypothetical protein KO561_14945 [Radiobacillus kanasensis]|uniref:hypothetical protein n=1 Tax=Radiobacillus kanasensis TaxID=2844358 RepID=UPI001E2C1D6C|nr:hypothetical protein [Radiobacillus kanasensis]UFT98483.1 hypothetical protein KO561_14945 [Radiobacillus kanasensis]
MTEKETQGSKKVGLQGLHTLVAISLLLVAALNPAISFVVFIAVFFFYLALINLLQKKIKLGLVLIALSICVYFLKNYI